MLVSGGLGFRGFNIIRKPRSLDLDVDFAEGQDCIQYILVHILAGFYGDCPVGIFQTHRF